MNLLALARQTERLHTRQRFSLSVDSSRLTRGLKVLRRRAPEHPFVLDLRAQEALPETALPPPPSTLSPAAEHFLAGRVDEALHHAMGLAASQPWASLLSCDLLLLRGSASEATSLLEGANEAWPDHPAVWTRRAHCKLQLGDPKAAREAAVRSLTVNPLLGTARSLRRRTSDALALSGLPLPAPHPPAPGVWLSAGQRALREQLMTSWSAGALPPGGPCVSELLQSPEGDATAVLHALDREQLLEAWQWSVGLSEANAGGFRRWRASNPLKLRQLWSADWR